jgi:sphingosine kinase
LEIKEHANYAREYVSNNSVNLKDFRGIVAVSGDGLVYEILNGIMDRDDWEETIKIPFAQLPGGSANALACNQAHLSNELFRYSSLGRFASFQSFLLSKSQPKPFDLNVIESEMVDKKIYSFLSIEWAFIADIDLESENYRWLGGLRFQVAAIKGLLSILK